MRVSWARVAAVILAGAAFSLPSAAWADTIASLDPADSLKTAGDAQQLCEEDFGGGPASGVDIWVFALPGAARRFTSLTVVLTNGTHTAAASGGIADVNGASKAWVRAPAGAALVNANAYVTGSEPDGLIRFGLAYVCAGGPKTPGPPSPSLSGVAVTAQTGRGTQTGGRFLVVASVVAAIIGAGMLYVISRGGRGAA